ncbi:hypothetical protein NM688_g4507 [Phlebia brevispora]|uniref:Uncharacterized protein n=1 Tax=Phlebia brevispora TaxID=194682 RepID=A0ACC1T2R4_9APHY|nr:hypothetical protein NM688_g4507 [Phlebia brevispora]
MDSQIDPASLNLLFAELRSIQAAQYSDLAAVIVLLYDVLLNMSDEVEYIWHAKWSFPKTLYLVARYYGLLHLVIAFLRLAPDYQHLCRGYLWFTSISGPGVFTAVVDMILVLRMCAFYDGSKRVLIFMSVMMTCEICMSFAMEIYASIKSDIPNPPAIPSISWTGCLAYPTRVITLIAWIPVMIVGFVCAIMTLYKYITLTNAYGYRGRRLSPLLHSFAWDGTLYFFLLFAAIMVAALMNLEIRNELARVGLTWIIAMYSIAFPAVVVLLYDILFNMGDEVEYIWQCQFIQNS